MAMRMIMGMPVRMTVIMPVLMCVTVAMGMTVIGVRVVPWVPMGVTVRVKSAHGPRLPRVGTCVPVDTFPETAAIDKIQ